MIPKNEGDEASGVAARAARESYGRLVAFLASRTGDVASAEDALAEAFLDALAAWPAKGIPDSPDAWLLAVARRRQTDEWRRRQTGAQAEEHLKLMADEIDAAAKLPVGIPDRRLALMFACAHPAIERGIRTPLILQTILGLTAADIGAAFLVPPATMSQRLVRAKARIKEEGIPFCVPEQEGLATRLEAVLDAVYAAYSKGWAETGEAGTSQLAAEAIWLGHVVVTLLPNEPEAKGMLALMLFAEARRAARRDAEDNYVPLKEQDMTLWDDSLIDKAETLLSEANANGPTGRFQIEAAIQSAHVARRLLGASDWAAIVALYDRLFTLAPSPVIALNRAVARAEIDGPAAALADLELIATDKRMSDYQPYWAARGHLCLEIGRRDDAYEGLTLAIGLSTEPAVRQYLQRRRDQLLSS